MTVRQQGWRPSVGPRPEGDWCRPATFTFTLRPEARHLEGLQRMESAPKPERLNLNEEITKLESHRLTDLAFTASAL